MVESYNLEPLMTYLGRELRKLDNRLVLEGNSYVTIFYNDHPEPDKWKVLTEICTVDVGRRIFTVVDEARFRKYIRQHIIIHDEASGRRATVSYIKKIGE
jgi:hypothetical protein